jgi:fermentation-respiration switch protein FrsA (DUF1100 family)
VTILILIVAVLYIAAAAALYSFQRRLIFIPWAGAPATHSVDAGMVVVTGRAADGVAVRHWYAAPQGKPRVVVLFHGNGGSVADLSPWAERFHSRGYGVLLADYRGYSGNPGAPSEDGIYQDARGVLAWLAAQGFAERDIILLGWSLGTGVAVQMATEHHPAALILLAPYTSLVDVAASQYRIFPVRLLMLDRFESIAKIKETAAPIFIAHGEADEVVSATLGRELFAAAPEPKRAVFLPHVHHWVDPSSCFDQVSDFLDATLADPSPTH